MSEQRVPFTVRDEARDGLADWWANRYDTWFFNQLCGNTGQTDTKYTGNQSAIAPSSVVMEATSTASLATTDVMSPDLINKALETAKTRAVTGLADPYPLRPLRMNGKAYYCMFMHEYQATDLRVGYAAGEWGDIQKAAAQGGQVSNNPIFNDALGVVAGVVLHPSTRVVSGATSTRRAVLCGAQAAAIAYGKANSTGNKFSWVEELFDYQNQLGVSAGMIGGLKKTQFVPAGSATDHGVITVVSYAVAHTS